MEGELYYEKSGPPSLSELLTNCGLVGKLRSLHPLPFQSNTQFIRNKGEAEASQTIGNAAHRNMDVKNSAT